MEGTRARLGDGGSAVLAQVGARQTAEGKTAALGLDSNLHPQLVGGVRVVELVEQAI